MKVLATADNKFCVTQILTYKCRKHGVNSLPNNRILNSSKLKEFAKDNFKFHENGMFSKRAENTVGKGEIAR